MPAVSMETLPLDDLLDRLHATGWSYGFVEYVSETGEHRFLIDASNGKQRTMIDIGVVDTKQTGVAGTHE